MFRAYNPSISAQFEEDDIFEAYSATDEAWYRPKPTSNILGKNSRELSVELIVQYIVMFCAIAHLKLSMQPLLPQAIGLKYLR